MYIIIATNLRHTNWILKPKLENTNMQQCIYIDICVSIYTYSYIDVYTYICLHDAQYMHNKCACKHMYWYKHATFNKLSS